MQRRKFLKQSLVAGSASLILPSLSFGASPKNETLRLAQIGTGRMGRGDMRNAMGVGVKQDVNARIVAVCDVDSNRVAVGKRDVEKFYKERGESQVEVTAYSDYREVLARDDIDGVIISTPERWHALIGIAAANAGKHIYLQKPVTYSIPEGQALVNAVRANNIVLQTGSQQRSSIYFYQVCTIIRNNWLGKLHTIEVEIPTDNGTALVEPTEAPVNLNYDMWLGPAQDTPYIEQGVHPAEGFGRPGWLQRQEYCLGMVTGWGSHMYDIAQWAMGTDHDSGPVEIAAKGDFTDRGIFDVHTSYEGEALYANGVRMTSRNGNAGVRFLTEDGWAYCSRGGFKCSDMELLRRKPTADEVSLYSSKNHMADFITSARDGRDPICPVEVGHRSNSICVLHNASMRVGGRNLKWDPQQEVIAGDQEATDIINVQMRAPWVI
jgi:myo-inositol 2-dehydrogenase/D-chiro-inositol 1-dehydrogenase